METTMLALWKLYLLDASGQEKRSVDEAMDMTKWSRCTKPGIRAV